MPLALVPEVRDEGHGDGRDNPERDVDDQGDLVAASHLIDHPAEEGPETEAEIHEGKEGAKDQTEMLRAVAVRGNSGGERGGSCPGDAKDEAVDVEEIPGWQQEQEEERQAAQRIGQGQDRGAPVAIR